MKLTTPLLPCRRSVGTVCKMGCLLKSLVGKCPETDIAADIASIHLKVQSSIAKDLAFRYHPILARLVRVQLSIEAIPIPRGFVILNYYLTISWSN